MDSFETEVRESWEDFIQEEIFIRRLNDRMEKLGSPADDYGNFFIFFKQVCFLNDTLNTKKGFTELRSIVNDCKTIFGERAMSYLTRYLIFAE